MAEDEGDFEEQLRQEKIAKDNEIKAGDGVSTRVDSDGIEYEFDVAKHAWFPKLSDDFIARYQMNYGSDVVASSDSGTSTAMPTVGSSYDSEEYRKWYEEYRQYCEKNGQQGEGASGTDDKNADNTKDYDAYCREYYANYYKWYYSQQQMGKEGESGMSQQKGEEGASIGNGNSTQKPQNSATPDNDEQSGKKGKKEKSEQPVGWFEMSKESNTNIYISGLPLDVTDDEFKELITKCGLVMIDPLTRKLKMKLYRDDNGDPKGDGRCCYIKPESVQLAMQLLDGSILRGSKLEVELAHFEMKGDYDPSKKKRKLTNKEKKKFKEKQAKLFDWRPDEPLASGTRPKNERVVILKNFFTVESFQTDPLLINEIREDLREECSKFGTVRKIDIHDNNPAGACSIHFASAEEADVCIEALNGRWFARRQITAETWDGKTKYHIEESAEEKEARLKKWEEFLQSEKDKKEASEKAEKEGTSREEKEEEGVEKRLESTRVEKESDGDVEEETGQEREDKKNAARQDLKKDEDGVNLHCGDITREKDPLESDKMIGSMDTG